MKITHKEIKNKESVSEKSRGQFWVTFDAEDFDNSDIIKPFLFLKFIEALVREVLLTKLESNKNIMLKYKDIKNEVILSTINFDHTSGIFLRKLDKCIIYVEVKKDKEWIGTAFISGNGPSLATLRAKYEFKNDIFLM